MNSRMLVSLLLAAGLAAGLPAAADEISVKSLSGPPSEFASHRLPSADDTAVASNILLVDRDSRGVPGAAALPPSGSTTSFNTSAGVGFSVVQATTVYPYFGPATFYGPTGNRYYFDGWSITCNWGSCGETSASIHMEAFSGSAGGVAVFSISGGEVPVDGAWSLTVQNPSSPQVLQGAVPEIETLISFDDNVVETAPEPQPCQAAAVAFPQEPEEPCLYLPRSSGFDLVDGAAPVFRLSFATNEMKRRGESSGILLSDLRVAVIDTRTRRAVHEEQLGLGRLAALPVDARGAQLVQLPALAAGNYTVRLDVRGNVPGIGPVERTALYFLPILPGGYQLTGDVRTTQIDGSRLELQLAVDSPDRATPHVYAYAEVWSGDGQKPIAWIGGMTQAKADDAGQLRLPMVLDGRWLALAGVAGDRLRLKNLRLQDPDTFIPLSQIADLPVELGSLPRSASLAADQVAVDDSLYMGRGDRTIRLPGGTNGGAAAVEAPEGGFTNTGIFLVHGWCSGITWPIGHFGRPGRVGGTEQFFDPSASRSHDAFAREIRDQGAARFIDSFTVVAHSQGGAASTHLRAFYNSLLDLSNAPRRIQTMGTPYNGSTLMDYYLATGPLGWIIASIFGQCTQSFDLGTLGSQLWLSNLPSWTRGEVFFYRTGYRRARNFWERLQFWRWRCNAASFVIPGWDDGVVADWQGHLNGGQNMGITESECHTSNMNHADQTENWNRNDILDREGRPQNLNRARTATTSASSTYTPGCSPGLHCYFPARVNDGDRSTALGGNTSWSNNSGVAMPQWVQLTWGTPITFSRADLYLTAGYVLRDFRIEFRATSTGAWQTLTTVTANTASFRTFTFTPRTAQAVRVVSLNGSAVQPGYARVNELEIY